MSDDARVQDREPTSVPVSVGWPDSDDLQLRVSVGACRLTIRPGEHGSTFGGNPLACRVAMVSLQVLQDEQLADNADCMGRRLREGLEALQSPHISTVRGKGLLNAIVIRHQNPEAAWELCMDMMENGLLAKPTHGDKIRFAPPLVITEAQVDEAIGIIHRSLRILD